MTDFEKIAVFDKLEGLFKDNPNITVERDENSISFSQVFTNNVHFDHTIPEAEKCIFIHTVTLTNNSYKTMDIIETKSLTPFGLKAHYQRGHFMQTGFTLGPGVDLNTGKPGIVKQKWSTNDIKKPVKECLNRLGIKKAGLFG